MTPTNRTNQGVEEAQPTMIFNAPQKFDTFMMLKGIFALFSLLGLSGLAMGFVAPVATNTRSGALVAGNNVQKTEATALCMSSFPEGLDRRAILTAASAMVVGSLGHSPVANALDKKSKIVIFGGAGYVGSHVVEILSKKGYENLVSVSRSSPEDQATRIQANVGKSLPIRYESLDASKEDLSNVLNGASVVISCVGIPPWGEPKRAGNGAVNIRIANAVKAAGIGRFVYIGLDSEFANGPAKFLFGDYVKGKKEAESAIMKAFGENAVIVKPAVIDGSPPNELRPPGPPGIALSPVEAVAGAVVAGALGQKSGRIDGYDAIVQAASA